MPRMSGYGTLQTDQKRTSTPVTSPVVLLTARTAVEHNIEGLKDRRGRLYHQAVQYQSPDLPLQQSGELTAVATGEIQQTATGFCPDACH